MTYKKLINLKFAFDLSSILMLLIAICLMALSGWKNSYTVFIIPVAFLMIASFITGYLIDRIYGKKLAEIKSELRDKE